MFPKKTSEKSVLRIISGGAGVGDGVGDGLRVGVGLAVGVGDGLRVGVGLAVGAIFSTTVTLHIAKRLLSAEYAVITAFPTETAVIFPFSSTKTTPVSLDSHRTVLFVAFDGITSAFNLCCS